MSARAMLIPRLRARAARPTLGTNGIGIGTNHEYPLTPSVATLGTNGTAIGTNHEYPLTPSVATLGTNGIAIGTNHEYPLTPSLATLGTNGTAIGTNHEYPLTPSVATPKAARSRGASGLGLALLALATGCSTISPGLQFKPSQLEARGTKEQPIAIVSISPKVLVDQAGARAKAAEGRAKDPLAADAASWQYRIAPYDVLTVIVWDHPELTIPAGEFRAAETFGNSVQADGTMFYPHVGVLQVAGKTLPEVRVLIADKLRRVIESPQLDVRVAAFRGQRMEVTGEVVQPSTLPITDVPLRVQDAIGAARGLTPNAWTRGVTLTRDGKTYRLDLQAFYDEGDVSQNWLLRHGDVVHVPSREENKVFVLGEVKRPSSKLMVRGRMSLAEAIGDSEGFDPTSSKPSDIYVFRGRYEAPEVYRLDASSADAMLLATAFQLEPRDVVYVAPYGLTNWNRVISQILPTVQGVWQTFDLIDRSVR